MFNVFKDVSRMARPSPSARLVALALVGSLLMFCGWIIAILPAFQHLRSIALVVVVALIGFGLVLIPSGLDFIWFPPRSNQKRGIGVLLISILPAALLFLITAVILPISLAFQVIAVVTEFLGMAIYGRAWWDSTHGRSR